MQSFYKMCAKSIGEGIGKSQEVPFLIGSMKVDIVNYSMSLISRPVVRYENQLFGPSSRFLLSSFQDIE